MSVAAVRVASNIMHVDYAGAGFYGGSGLGADLEAAGDGDFDFAGGEVEHDGDAAAAARLAGDHALEAGEGAGLAYEHPQPRRGERNDRIERLDFLHGQTQVFLLAAHIDPNDQWLASVTGSD